MILSKPLAFNAAGHRNFRKSYLMPKEVHKMEISPESTYGEMGNFTKEYLAFQCGIRESQLEYNLDMLLVLVTQEQSQELHDQVDNVYTANNWGCCASKIKAGLDIIINGRKENEQPYDHNCKRSIKVEGITKQSLARNPIRYLLEQYQIWIVIGFNLETDSFKLAYLGVDVEKITKVPLTNQIYKHEVVEISTRNVIKFQYHTIFKNQRYVTTASYHKKIKRCELQHGKQTSFIKGYGIEDPRCYPVSFQCEGDVDWKISLSGYDKKNGFNVAFNDQEFFNLAYQSQIVASGPQNITRGRIQMNGQRIYDGEFKSYEEFKDTLPNQAVLTDLFIGQFFQTTSADVVNQVIDDFSRLIHFERGLEVFQIKHVYDNNQLKSWPFSKIVSKALLLHTLKIEYLRYTTAENRSTIIDFCTEVCKATDRLHILGFESTGFSAYDGDKFWSSLANDDDCVDGTLEELQISFEEAWFSSGRMDSVVPLTRVLLRQGTTLKKFKTNNNDLSVEQKQAIHDALASNPNCVFRTLW